MVAQAAQPAALITLVTAAAAAALEQAGVLPVVVKEETVEQVWLIQYRVHLLITQAAAAAELIMVRVLEISAGGGGMDQA